MHTLRFTDRRASEFHYFHANLFWDRKYTNENATTVLNCSGVPHFEIRLFFNDLLVVEIIIYHHLHDIDSSRQEPKLVNQHTVITIIYRE